MFFPMQLVSYSAHFSLGPHTSIYDCCQIRVMYIHLSVSTLSRTQVSQVASVLSATSSLATVFDTLSICAKHVSNHLRTSFSSFAFGGVAPSDSLTAIAATPSASASTLSLFEAGAGAGGRRSLSVNVVWRLDTALARSVTAAATSDALWAWYRTAIISSSARRSSCEWAGSRSSGVRRAEAGCGGVADEEELALMMSVRTRLCRRVQNRRSGWIYRTRMSN